MLLEHLVLVRLQAFLDNNDMLPATQSAYRRSHSTETAVLKVYNKGCISEVCHWMSANRLKLNTDKTELVWTGSKHNLASASCSDLSHAWW